MNSYKPQAISYWLEACSSFSAYPYDTERYTPVLQTVEERGTLNVTKREYIAL